MIIIYEKELIESLLKIDNIINFIMRWIYSYNKDRFNLGVEFNEFVKMEYFMEVFGFWWFFVWLWMFWIIWFFWLFFVILIIFGNLLLKIGVVFEEENNIELLNILWVFFFNLVKLEGLFFIRFCFWFWVMELFCYFIFVFLINKYS